MTFKLNKEEKRMISFGDYITPEEYMDLRKMDQWLIFDEE